MSSGSESDEDYVPGEPEKLSEEESANEETDQQFQNELEQKAKKRKILQESKGKKIRKTRNAIKEIKPESPEPEEEIGTPANPEEEKKKEDDLWAKFLEGTDSKPRSSSKDTTSSAVESSKPIADKVDTLTKVAPPSDTRTKEQKIFEFAGETIIVENNKIKGKIKDVDSPATDITIKAAEADGPSHGRPGKRGGLSNILGQLNKKNQLTTLEKSKLDWTTYKQEEGIEEEIQSHNKGKNGFLDRRDFLERADLRQYEIERDLRMKRRSNR